MASNGNGNGNGNGSKKGLALGVVMGVLGTVTGGVLLGVPTKSDVRQMMDDRMPGLAWDAGSEWRADVKGSIEKLNIAVDLLTKSVTRMEVVLQMLEDGAHRDRAGQE